MAASPIPRLDLHMVQGKTFRQVIRWESEPFVFKAISSILQTAPAQIEATGHGLVDGWRAAVVSVRGMRAINAQSTPPRDSDFHRVTIIDVDTVAMNEVNAADFSAYTSGGYLQFYTPKSLDGCTARMTIRTKAGGTSLLSLTTGVDARIVLDDAAKTITLLVSAADTAALTWQRGVYDLEIEDADGFVTGLYQGTVTVTREETT